MDLSNVARLDSIILLGIVNEKLRLECDSFEDLVSMYEMDVSCRRKEGLKIAFVFIGIACGGKQSSPQSLT